MKLRVWLPPVVFVLLALLCVRLGVWQEARAEFKTQLQSHFDNAGASHELAPGETLNVWQRVAVRGTWMAEATVFLDNRVHAGQPGYEVLTPFKLRDGRVLIVNRGWVVAGLHREVLPKIASAAGELKLDGLLQQPDLKGYRLDNGQETGQVWQRADPAHFAARISGTPESLVLYQESASEDGLLRDWPRPDFGVDKHKAYALQWFVFALMFLGLSAWWVWRAVRRKNLSVQ